jgi:hypothetical protein
MENKIIIQCVIVIFIYIGANLLYQKYKKPDVLKSWKVLLQETLVVSGIVFVSSFITEKIYFHFYKLKMTPPVFTGQPDF